jgi:hypothetical protein
MDVRTMGCEAVQRRAQCFAWTADLGRKIGTECDDNHVKRSLHAENEVFVSCTRRAKG